MSKAIHGFLILALFLAATAYADTRVFLYNNTLQTLNLDLRQTDTILGANHWTQGLQSIGPTKADEILSIKKSGGVRNNETYGFEFDVSDGASTLVLKIRIEGRSIGRNTLQAVNDDPFVGDHTLRSAQWGNRTVQYRQERNGDFMFVIADPSQPLFRFPVQDRSLISEGNRLDDPLAGPLTPDMRTGDRNRGLGYNCLSFDGAKAPPHCYGGHEGTDFMLKGGFKQMDRPGNFIVAARAGTVRAVVQDLFDRCKAKPWSNDRNSPFQPDCKGNNTDSLDGNHIVIDHGDGVYTMYYHLKTGSALVREGDLVTCGQPIASIGSSGFSTKPHLHFEVLMCRDGETCDWAASGARGTVSVNPYNGAYTGRGYWTDQGSGRLPSSTCAPGQPVYEGPVAPPARGCREDTDCGPGSFCNKRLGENRCLADGSFAVGIACYKNKECRSGKCEGSGDARQCVCNEDGDCADGQYCNKRLGQNRCIAISNIPLGQACRTNDECLSGKCQGSGTARQCVCSNNSDCATGEVCDTRLGKNRCLANASLLLGDRCEANSECATGKCQGTGSGRQCVCNSDNDCGIGQYCNNRAAKNRCLADASSPIGAPCNKNRECVSNKCQGSGDDRACVCASDNDCGSGQRCKQRIGKNRCE